MPDNPADTTTLRPSDVPTWGTPGSGVEPDPYRSPRTFGRVYDFSPVLAIGNWTPDRCGAAIDAHDTGVFLESSVLYTQILSDAYIQSCATTRALGLLNRDRVIKPNPRAKNKKLAVRAADMMRERGDELFPNEIMKTLSIWGEGLGFAPAQLVWYADDGAWWPRLQPWRPQHVYWRQDLHEYVTTTYQGEAVIKPGLGQWLLYTPYGFSYGWLEAAVRPLAKEWLVITYAIRDAARHSEVHGSPMRVAKYPANAPAEDKRLFVAQVANLGSETTIGLPQNIDGTAGYDIALVEASSTSSQQFQASIEQAQHRIAIRLLGQHLTVDAGGNGSYAAASVQDRIRTDYIRSDDASWKSTLFEQVSVPWARFNFGDESLAPIVCRDLEPPSDLQARAQALASFGQAFASLKQAGAPVDEKALVESFDLPVGEPMQPPQQGEPQGEEPNGPEGSPEGEPEDEDPKDPDDDPDGGESEPEPEPEPDDQEKATTLAAPEFDESKHPRAKDGKFGSGGGSSVAKEPKKPAAKKEAKPKAPAKAEPKVKPKAEKAPKKGPATKPAKKETKPKVDPEAKKKQAEEKKAKAEEAKKTKAEEKARAAAQKEAEKKAKTAARDAAKAAKAKAAEFKKAQQTPKQAVETWMKRFPYSLEDPKELHKTLSDAFGSKGKTVPSLEHLESIVPGAKLTSISVDSGRITTRHTLLDENGREIGDATREFYRLKMPGTTERKLIAVHNIFEVRDQHHQAGRASEMMAASLAMYKQAGVDEIHLKAAWTGRYAWAKQGFEMSPSHFAEHKSTMARWLESEGHVPAGEGAKVVEQFKSAKEMAAYDPGKQVEITYRGRTTKGHLGKAYLLSTASGTWSGRMPLKGQQATSILFTLAAKPENDRGEDAETDDDFEPTYDIGAMLEELDKAETTALAGDWDEDKHPRAKDGKFGSGGGSSGGSSKESKPEGKPKSEPEAPKEPKSDTKAKAALHDRVSKLSDGGEFHVSNEEKQASTKSLVEDSQSLETKISKQAYEGIDNYCSNPNFRAVVAAQRMRTQAATLSIEEKAKLMAVIDEHRERWAKHPGTWEEDYPERAMEQEKRFVEAAKDPARWRIFCKNAARDLDIAHAEALKHPEGNRERTVYRGMVVNDQVLHSFLDAHEKGQLFNTRGQSTSTTVSPTHALKFVGKTSDTAEAGAENQVMLRISAKKSLPVGDMARSLAEQEVVLPHDAKLRITKVERQKSNYVGRSNQPVGEFVIFHLEQV